MAGRRTIPIRFKLQSISRLTEEPCIKIVAKITDGPDTMIDRTLATFLSYNEAKKLQQSIQELLDNCLDSTFQRIDL